MLLLIKKELTANVKYMLFSIAIFIVYVFIFTKTDVALFTMCLIFCFYALSTTNLVLDERYKIDLLLTTLPVRRKDIVLSKYLLVLIIFVFCFLLYTLLAVGSRAAGYDRIPMLDLMSASLGFLVLSVFNGIVIPLTYKFGAQATRFVSFILLFVIFFSSSFLGNVDLSGLLRLLNNLSVTSFSLLLFAVGLLISALSYMLAAPIYTRKDL